MSSSLRALACAALLLVSGCEALPLAPSSIAGTYALLSVDGVPLPAELNSAPTTEWTITADTMHVEVGGEIMGRACHRRIDYVLDSAAESCQPWAAFYRVKGHVIEIHSSCAPGQACLMIARPPRQAWRDGDDLVVRNEGDLLYRYRRIQP